MTGGLLSEVQIEMSVHVPVKGVLYDRSSFIRGTDRNESPCSC